MVWTSYIELVTLLQKIILKPSDKIHSTDSFLLKKKLLQSSLYSFEELYSRTLDCEQLGLRVFYKTSKNFEGILTW